MENICRICLSSPSDLLPLVRTASGFAVEVLKIGEMFEECIGIKIEDIPKCYKICMSCKMQLTCFYDFKTEAVKTHERLLKLSVDWKEEDLIESYIIHQIEPTNDDEKDEALSLKRDEEAYLIEYVDEDSTLDRESTAATPLSVESLNEITEEHLDDEYQNGSCEDGFSEDESFQLYLDVSEESTSKAPVKRSTRKKNKHKWKHHCEPCGKFFRNEQNFQAHQNIHMGLPPYRCEPCNKGFGYKVNYEYHMRNHNNARSFECAECDKRFLCKWDLKVHMRVHKDIRPYVCDICGKQFRVRSHMTDHLETHNIENTHECPVCHLKYKTKATLKIHITSIHAQKKQFFCAICERTFNRKHHLKVHYKVHSNPKKEKIIPD